MIFSLHVMENQKIRESFYKSKDRAKAYLRVTLKYIDGGNNQNNH